MSFSSSSGDQRPLFTFCWLQHEWCPIFSLLFVLLFSFYISLLYIWLVKSKLKWLMCFLMISIAINTPINLKDSFKECRQENCCKGPSELAPCNFHLTLKWRSINFLCVCVYQKVLVFKLSIPYYVFLYVDMRIL